MLPVAHVPGKICYFDAKTSDQKGKTVLRMPPAKKNSRCGSKEKKHGDRIPAALKSTV